jgi:hypothetical protein
VGEEGPRGIWRIGICDSLEVMAGRGWSRKWPVEAWTSRSYDGLGPHLSHEALVSVAGFGVVSLSQATGTSTQCRFQPGGRLPTSLRSRAGLEHRHDDLESGIRCSIGLDAACS